MYCTRSLGFDEYILWKQPLNDVLPFPLVLCDIVFEYADERLKCRHCQKKVALLCDTCDFGVHYGASCIEHQSVDTCVECILGSDKCIECDKYILFYDAYTVECIVCEEVMCRVCSDYGDKEVCQGCAHALF